MTKFFDAKVPLAKHKTIAVQIAAESEAEAIALATNEAVAKEPQFSPVGEVSLTLIGESDVKVGARVVHRLFGAGVVEQMVPSGPNGGFRFRIAFDKGDTKEIQGPGAVLRPEELADHDPRNLPNYKAGFNWKRNGQTLELIGTAINTSDRVDPALLEVLIWCRENIKDSFKYAVDVKHRALLNDELTGIHHVPHLTYTVTLSFDSDVSLTRFFMVWKD